MNHDGVCHSINNILIIESAGQLMVFKTPKINSAALPIILQSRVQETIIPGDLRVVSVDFSGTMLLTGNNTGQVKLWSDSRLFKLFQSSIDCQVNTTTFIFLVDLKSTFTHFKHQNCLSSCIRSFKKSFSVPERASMAAGFSDGSIFFWSSLDMKPQHISIHTAPVRALVFYSFWLISASDDMTIKVLQSVSAKSCELLHIFTLQTPAKYLCLGLDCMLYAAGGNSTFAFDLRVFKPVGLVGSHQSEICGIFVVDVDPLLEEHKVVPLSGDRKTEPLGLVSSCSMAHHMTDDNTISELPHHKGSASSQLEDPADARAMQAGLKKQSEKAAEAYFKLYQNSHFLNSERGAFFTYHHEPKTFV